MHRTHLFLYHLAFALTTHATKPAWFTEWSVVRGQAELPCLVPQPTDPADKPLLALWYKESQPTVPIYSYDTRSGSFSEGIRWADSGYLGSRAFFRIMSDPPTLVVDDVRVADQAVYTCRVDYKIRPSAITKVNLTIVVPPGPPIILDATGRTLEGSVGPLEEGSHTHLTCRSVGGSPPPTLTWWRDGHRLNQYESIRDGSVDTRISVVATRSLQGATLSCQALNNNITEPSTTALTVNVLLRPLSVEIVGTSVSSPLSSGRAVELVCRAVGSRPPARIKWYKGSKQMTDVTHTVMNEGNVTTGSVILMPTRQDDGKRVTCEASNPEIANSELEDSATLTVLYKPEVQLALGRALDPKEIKEGDDVYFECTIHANPVVHRVAWYHNGELLEANKSAGLLISENSLVLQKVKRKRAGDYTCAAHNLEGQGLSNSVKLNIMFAPVCASSGRRTQGVARMESANVVCQVEAYPPQVNFTWRFNGSSEGEAVPLKALQQQGTSSMLNYTASMEHDYGTLLCWAMNKIGMQKEPCVIHLIPAGQQHGPPDPPRNCSITNQTSEALVVECTPGFDGGLAQHFLMEAWDENMLLSNTTSLAPEFVVRGLEAGMGVTLKVHAINSKGQSASVSLEADIMKVAEKRMGPPEEAMVPPVVGAVVGGVGAVLVVVIVGVILTHYAHRAHVCTRAQKEDTPPNLTNVYAAGKGEAQEEEDAPGTTNPDVLLGTGTEEASTQEVLSGQSHRCVEAVAVLQGNTRSGGVTTTLPHPKGLDVEYVEVMTQGPTAMGSTLRQPRQDSVVYSSLAPQSYAYPVHHPHHHLGSQVPAGTAAHRSFGQYSSGGGNGGKNGRGERTGTGMVTTTSLHDLAGAVHSLHGGHHPSMTPTLRRDEGVSVYGTLRRGGDRSGRDGGGAAGPGPHPHAVGTFLATSHQESAV
ncbi:nephrin-like [Macrobrachium rosenbergii]|uniref:nephrin-like n=1 Tax=Macrobrachium rosenbergii TaxID=79674 RepID=UPI0034D5B2D0